MVQDKKIWMASSDKNLYLLPRMANRHGLIAGATGTGKTVTMKVMAESFSDMGVPVFLADIKGDLSGLCKKGAMNENIEKRLPYFGLDALDFRSYPTRFWDIFGEKGIPVRVSVSEMGPVLLSRLLGLTEVQQGVLNIVFRVADDNGLLLLDLKDLRAMLQFVGDNRAEYSVEYGNVSTASIGAIQRALLSFEDEGGDIFFGEPSLDIRDWIRTDLDGRGYINILSSTRLVSSPTVYGTFLLWMLTELFEKLPEVGDLDRPRMVFFFDEAHLLFDDCPKALVQKIVQVVKLIRSKAVGVYFITQSPSDIPNDVLAQLSNRVQHALRAYTPAEQKTVRAAAKAFRENKDINTEEALMELGVGEALVSFLDEEGIPEIVERAKILPPQSLMGAAEEEDVQKVICGDEFYLKYAESIDRESAYEVIMAAKEKLEALRAEEAEREAEEKLRAKEAAAREKEEARQLAAAQKAAEKEAAAREKAAAKEAAAAAKEAEKQAEARKKAMQRAATNAASSLASSLSTNLINSVTGGKTKSTRQIASQAAKSALSSVARSSSTAILRGLFGTKK